MKPIIIKASVLKWTITSSGLELKELSDITGISLDSLETWTSKNSRINVDDLKLIAKEVGRYLSIFLLPDTPNRIKQYIE